MPVRLALYGSWHGIGRLAAGGSLAGGLHAYSGSGQCRRPLPYLHPSSSLPCVPHRTPITPPTGPRPSGCKTIWTSPVPNTAVPPVLCPGPNRVWERQQNRCLFQRRDGRRRPHHKRHGGLRQPKRRSQKTAPYDAGSSAGQRRSGEGSPVCSQPRGGGPAANNYFSCAILAGAPPLPASPAASFPAARYKWPPGAVNGAPGMAGGFAGDFRGRFHQPDRLLLWRGYSTPSRSPAPMWALW